MPHSSESDSDAPEAISLKTAKKSSKAQEKLVQDRNTQVAKRAKDKNRARDARLKAAKEEATNNRSTESNPSLEKHGEGKKERSVRRRRPVAEDDGDDDAERIDVGPNEEEEEEEEDPTRKRIRVRMEAAMHDAEEEGAMEGLPEGLSDGDDDAEALDGDFALGEDASITDEDEELEGISVDDEEMKDPEADDDEWANQPGSKTSLGDPGYLPEELFAQAAAAITAQKPTGGRAKAVERKKRNRKRVRAKDLVVGSRTVRVAKPPNPVVMAAYTVPSKPAQRFMRQHLKGGLATKGWERRPVNVGSLAVRGGPPKGFRRT